MGKLWDRFETGLKPIFQALNIKINTFGYSKNNRPTLYVANHHSYLDSLILKKSDDAPKAILMLSDIMRYMLHDSNHKRVTLQKEIDYISNFIT